MESYAFTSYRYQEDFNRRHLAYYIWRRLRWTLGDKSPFFAYLKITERCNLDCPYCPWHSKSNNYREELSTEAWKDIITKVADLGVEVMIFEGGEPTLRVDLSELLDCAHNRGASTVLATNGTTNPWRLSPTAFTVSIDGPQEVHDKIRGAGTYSRLLRNLAENPGRPVGSITVVNRINLPYLREMLLSVHPLVTGSGFTFQYDYKGGDPNCLSPAELVKAKLHIKELKRDPRFQIINPISTLTATPWRCHPGIALAINHRGQFSRGCFVAHTKEPACDKCELACYRLLSTLHDFNFEAWFNLYRVFLKKI